MPEPIKVSYFSDVLCVWAYVAQVRLDELQKHYGDKIGVTHHFIPVFGDTGHRIGEGWKERGGFEGYAAHVVEICEDFPDMPLSADAWTIVRPTSSAPSHQFLKALQLLEADGALSSDPVEEFGGRSLFEEAAWRMRRAFFGDGRDMSHFGELSEVVAELDVPATAIKELFDNGRALAAVSRDADLRTEQRIDGSPTYLLNDGRQKLYGNVGYKIIEANVEEVLRRPKDAASWC